MRKEFQAAVLYGMLSISIGCENTQSNPDSQITTTTKESKPEITPKENQKAKQDIEQAVLKVAPNIQGLSIYIPSISYEKPQQIQVKFNCNGVTKVLLFPNLTGSAAISKAVQETLSQQQTEAPTSPLPSLSPE
jgi:hypothetical protein